ncbi:hypothetical protein [Notoacmeibacter marinus]|uniref:hypothetical protein n=1 Tax=Notoacmeibacter marinus TaxID=1876515 RepID=UPI0019D4C802|nr:hypothetical protein [Notoacmeibacter marinus]
MKRGIEFVIEGRDRRWFDQAQRSGMKRKIRPALFQDKRFGAGAAAGRLCRTIFQTLPVGFRQLLLMRVQLIEKRQLEIAVSLTELPTFAAEQSEDGRAIQLRDEVRWCLVPLKFPDQPCLALLLPAGFFDQALTYEGTRGRQADRAIDQSANNHAAGHWKIADIQHHAPSFLAEAAAPP